MLSFVSSQVCTVVFGYLLVVCFKWSPQTERYLKALALPVWAVLLFYIGEWGDQRKPGEPVHLCWLSFRTFMQTPSLPLGILLQILPTFEGR